MQAVGKSGDEMIFEPGKRNILNQILQTHDLCILFGLTIQEMKM
jgi:hypothetical protein